MLALSRTVVAASVDTSSDEPAWVKDLVVRPGYAVTLAADNLVGVRHLESDGAGRIYASRPYAPPAQGERRSTNGEILCLRDRDGDGYFEWRETFVTGPVTLHGLCFVPDAPLDGKPVPPGSGTLWYSTSGSIWKARDSDGDGKADLNIEVVKEGSLPSGGANWWRSVVVVDGRLYTSIGDTANITDESESERQKIWSFSLDGADKRLFASGLRSTEKLRARPGSKAGTALLWGADQGSDWFGRVLGEKPGEGGTGQPFSERYPPDEINVYVEGGHYGHPFLVGDRVPRPEFSSKSDLVTWAAKTTVPAHNLPAHAGAGGFCFLDPVISARFAARPGVIPTESSKTGPAMDMIVACHGSWSTTEPSGYSLERVLFDQVEDRPIGHVTLVRGVVKGKDGKWRPLIRPADVVHAADGTVLFSCDMNGLILRVSGVRKP
jgi:glucose/arabinose dehydrogenase